MSNSEERDVVLFEMMLKHIVSIENYLLDVGEDDFLNDEQKQDACLMKLIVIGEKTIKISEGTKQKFPQIDWKIIKAARNFYVHVYDGIEWAYIWELFKTDLKKLKEDILNIMKELEKEN
ncbi:MAG: DUF86 domain-containing protein [Edaphocola sp.]